MFSDFPDSPSCPKCTGPMTKRQNSKTGHPFWGCDAYKYPEDDARHCDGTIEIRDTDDDDYRWRRDAALAITLAMIANWRNVFDPTDARTVSQHAVQLADELIEELRK